MKRRLRRIALVAAIIGLPAFADQADLLRGLDDAASAARMAASPREASGAFVHLAIDTRALDAVGVWPWPRSVHARIVDELVAAGAADIALDVDFSHPSRPSEDAALASALAAAGGSVILPAFPRTASTGRDTLPIPSLRAHAWIGSVVVEPDGDGRIRRMPNAAEIEGETVPAMAVLLGGALGARGGELRINFALDPATIPTHSVADLLEGRLGPDAFAGRSVVLGAEALELGDRFAVPVHGIVPGPVLQILAAETIVQGIALVPIRATPVQIAVGLLVLLILGQRGPANVMPRLALLGSAAIALETVALALQVRDTVELPTAAGHLALLLAAALVSSEELQRRGWKLARAQARADNTERVLWQVVADSSDAIVIVDEDERVRVMSRHATRVFGPLGRPLAELVPPDMRTAIRAALAGAHRGDAPSQTPMESVVRVGGEERILEYAVTASLLEVPGGGPPRHVASLTARDVTDRRLYLARLNHLARHDEATGAWRRSEFLARLAETVATWPVRGGTCAIFVLNLHRFKAMNDMLGRHVGDGLLAAAAERLGRVDGSLSPPARLDGDTFALFSREPFDRDAAEGVAALMVETVSRPYEIAGTTARVGARVGLALFHPAVERHTEAVLGAELALDEARGVAGSAVRVYDEASAARQARRRKLERALWDAVERGEIHVAYQPQVSLQDMRLVGAEALLRWEHPTLGPVPPVEFIKIAEANGLVESLGRLVLETACTAAAGWPSELEIAVNVSPIQFARGDVAADVRRALVASGLPPRRLTLEITESSLLEAGPDVIELLHDLRAQGISLALDDFGSGYSSLGYLPRLPLDKIKLDRMFTQRLGQDRATDAITASVCTLSESLGITLLAEGIETEAQLDTLRRLGCGEGQGYLFGKAMPAEGILDIHRAQAPRPAAAVSRLRQG